ncbi:hypothetical protein AACH06_01320 [Ideonella sp. DXS29W]|uniref:Uncharacterized protein n=1 Tax=Ideonella lacteola TaxID=2984193 RepID=A0ABU9BIA7_9BURK
MFPWLWFWAPQFHFPWSGDVAQRVEPNTHWFFQGISPTAGHADIEEKAFGVASYGKQLGLITEVLLALAEQADRTAPETAESLAKLKAIASEIEAIKRHEYDQTATELEAQVKALQRQGGPRYAELVERLRPLLAATAPGAAPGG